MPAASRAFLLVNSPSIPQTLLTCKDHPPHVISHPTASGGKARVTWMTRLLWGRHSSPTFIILHILNPGYSREGLRAPGNNCQMLLASSVVILQLFLFLFVLSAIYFAMYSENKMDWWMERGMDGWIKR